MPRGITGDYFRSLDSVRVDKLALVEAIRANRDGHREAFLEAQRGWHRIVVAELEKRMEDARAGRQISGLFHYPEPQDHTKDYDRVLKMLDMSLDTILDLPQGDFARYVMDDWEWKAQWTTSNAMYAGAAKGR